MAEGRNPYEVTQNLSSSSSPIAQQNKWHVDCHDNFTEEQPGVCDDLWYDGQDAFSLFNLGERNMNYYELMDLFYVARRCRDQSLVYNSRLYGAGSGFVEEAEEGVGWTGHLYINPESLDVQCESNVRICS